MKEFLFWWIGIEAVGLAAFPLTYAIFRGLPDRGFAFSKVVGLLLLGYGIWAGAVIGLFPNARGSIILVLLVIAGVSALVWGRHREELSSFVRNGWRYMLFVEGLFLLVLGAAVFIRSFAPEIMWGEKPFELAFLNAISRSEFFPPRDPWLAGHSISYYYFGYVLIAVPAKLLAIEISTAFYLGLSLIAALASVSVFGLVYNLIALRRDRRGASEAGPAFIRRAAVFGVAGAALMAVVGNLAGVFELMARHGVGSSGFYSRVGIFGLDGPYDCAAAPGECGGWYPTRFWWWWKATRMGSGFDIQEFPFFSFQFGDLHPHVLVMPFLITLLALGLALVVSARRDRGREPVGGSVWAPVASVAVPFWQPLLLGGLVGGMGLAVALTLEESVVRAIVLALIAGGVQALVGTLANSSVADGAERLDGLWWLRNPGRYVLLGLFLGGIIFIDTWTLPLLLTLLLAAAAVANWIRTDGRPLSVLVDSAGFAIPIVAAMFFFYIPFHLNSELEVQGLGVIQTSATDFPPPESEVTRPLHFLLFWGPLLWVALSFLLVHVIRHAREMAKGPLLGLAALAWVGPLVVWAVWIISRGGFGAIGDELSERGGNLLTLLLIAAALTLAGLSFVHQLQRPAGERDRGQLFAYLLATFAFLMLLGGELFYVRDLFNWRANTIFRFWHQSWIILAVVGGFGLYRLTAGWRLPQVRLGEDFWPRLAVAGVVAGAIYMLFVALEPWEVLWERWWTATLGLWVAGFSVLTFAMAAALGGASLPVAWQRVVWVGVTAAVLAGALVYPVTVSFERTAGFRNEQSLNGLVHVRNGNPDEYEAIRWLQQNVQGVPVILEAVGGSYSDGARVSSRTGLPTVLGWPGHQNVWRGSNLPFLGREDDIRTIYTTTDAEEARGLLERYGVEYVYVGYLERDTYGEGGLAKFEQFMTPVFSNASVTIYQMPGRPAVVSRP